MLTAEQQTAVDALTEAAGSGKFTVALLHGVTGSGKTEVYRQLATAALASKRQALILVPEIALTPAVADSFRQAFGARVAIQHSGLSDGARHDQWYRIRRGEVDVVVGTRSAVFAPLPSVGLIVVDEEHDASYKQEESPRYHVGTSRSCGQNAAVPWWCSGRRRHLSRAIGTPQADDIGGWLSRSASTPAVAHGPGGDMREEFAEHGPDVVLSRPLVEAIDARLSRESRCCCCSIDEVSRPPCSCRQCGRSLECPNCSVSLTFHRCRSCPLPLLWVFAGASGLLPGLCRTLSRADRFRHRTGRGEIVGRWPDARVARLDRDTVRRQGAAARLLERFASGAVDVLVGTQMVAKGHDFPRVTLVGVISADVGLGMADFRAAERTFQLLTQVAGRAGRGEVPGEAFVQTLYPDHYSIRHACNQAYGPFYDEEMRFRKAMRYPPVVSLLSAVVRGTTFQQRCRMRLIWRRGCGASRVGSVSRDRRRHRSAGSVVSIGCSCS